MRKPDLIVHTRTHTQEKPFKWVKYCLLTEFRYNILLFRCTVCDKRFGAKQILYVHLQTHSSTRKVFNCQDCNLQFLDKNQAKLHDESQHPDRRPFFCNYCKRSFKHEHLLKIHKKHKHKTDEPCTVMTNVLSASPNNDFNVWSL